MQKSVFITGAGRGIGKEIALFLSKNNYEVFACSRTEKELAELKKNSQDKIHTSVVDITNETALRDWFQKGFSNKTATPWGLITVAGIHGEIAPILESDFSEWKKATEVNLFATVLATQIFAKELVRQNQKGRILLLSGGGATKAIANMSAYSASKTAVVRFGENLALELKTHGITVNSIAPGAINTALTETILTAGPAKAGKDLYDRTLKQVKQGGSSAIHCAELTHYLLSEKASEITGKLLSAIWDPWESLHEFSDLLENSDLYTLRRILPADRGATTLLALEKSVEGKRV